MFDLNTPEEEIKNKVGQEFFGDFDTTERTNNIDFMVAPKITHPLRHPNAREGESLRKNYYLWAEAKKGNKSDIYASIVQLILTIGKAKLQDSLIPPHFLGAFDAQKIAFIEFSEIAHIFSQNDFNWSVTPSNHESKEFKQLYKLIVETLESENLLFRFATQSDELREFIEDNFALDSQGTQKIKITKNNFFNIYLEWLKRVKPTISINWESAKVDNILDSDFYLADLLSRNNSTKEIYENLRVLLQSNYYEVKLESSGKYLNFTKFSFKDSQQAHNDFWRIYERPPKEEFWDYIIERRDLLVPQDIRERKGAFFTPSAWVAKAQDYLAQSLGESWQDEYYIWDCCAGTGNLLAGLTNARNVFASTLDNADVEVMQERRLNGANLMESNIFQFDFLNDSFFDRVDDKGNIIKKSKLPESLQNIIKNEPQKLVIFINPPYAEATNRKATSKTGLHKDSVARDNVICEKYKNELGKANNELFAQFFMRIYKEIPNCILGSFSTLKYVNSANFVKFREIFLAKFLKGFIVPADSFDNVNGQFSIGFLVWNLGDKKEIKKVKVDIFNIKNKRIGKKNFYHNVEGKFMSDWIREFYDKKSECLAYVILSGTDISSSGGICIERQATPNSIRKHMNAQITKYNLIPFGVFFAIRKSIKRTWINDRDQFLHPKNKWRNDKEFHNDCLTYTLFHGKNRISAKDDINHFIPFSEVEVGAKGRFQSDFIFRFINGKVKNGELDDCFIPSAKIAFSAESEAVFKAGLELWRYYHKCAKRGESYLNDASLYDIKEFFQGRNENGKMNAKSTDSHYNDLIADLRIALQTLAQKIEPKIYEYEFLRE
ncbi:hypothetical protein [Helicobacter sp. 23-1045]